MKVDDLCFYHSNIGKEIVELLRLSRALSNKTDKEKRFVAVQVRFKEKFKNQFKLEKLKKRKFLIYPLLNKADYQ